MKIGLASLTAILAIAAATGAAAKPADEHMSLSDWDRAIASDERAAIVNAMAGDPELRRPLARLRSPLCLTVAANDVAFAHTLATRIIDNAKAAGVRTRRARCTPNALVTFSADAVAQIAGFRAEGRKLFRQMSETEIDTALAASGPAYVFRTVQPTPRIGEGDAGLVAPADMNWTKESSYQRTPQDMVTALVVIDAGAIAGLSPVQLADYATLRLLAPTQDVAADTPAAPRSILSLFAAPEAAPREMTSYDRAYLKTLYRMKRTAFAREVLYETIRATSEDAGD